MKTIALFTAALLSTAAVGCHSDHPHGDMHHGGMEHHDMAGMQVTHAIAMLKPTAGNEARGHIRFSSEGPGKVRAVVDIEGLAPNSTHGIHIHEFGDTSSPDGASAGGHFNPNGHQHGGPDSPEHHVGDMGNIVADEQGHGHLEITLTGVNLYGPNAIIGRSVVLHAKADDMHSQPSGESGARIAYGVIGAAKP